MSFIESFNTILDDPRSAFVNKMLAGQPGLLADAQVNLAEEKLLAATRLRERVASRHEWRVDAHGLPLPVSFGQPLKRSESDVVYSFAFALNKDDLYNDHETKEAFLASMEPQFDLFFQRVFRTDEPRDWVLTEIRDSAYRFAHSELAGLHAPYFEAYASLRRAGVRIALDGPALEVHYPDDFVAAWQIFHCPRWTIVAGRPPAGGHSLECYYDHYCTVYKLRVSVEYFLLNVATAIYWHRGPAEVDYDQ